jgi:integrase
MLGTEWWHEMARPRKPWYRKSRCSWFVSIAGKQHNLGPNKEEALQRYHALMAEAPEQPSAGSVAALLDAFVVYCCEHKAPRTVRWYEDYLQDFLDYLKSSGHSPATLPTLHITPKLVRAWIDQRGTAKRARITAIKTAYRWAHAEGWIKANPIAAMKRPPQANRTKIISLREMKSILRHTKDKCFRDLLMVSWDTGARPQELRLLRDFHLDLSNHRCVIPAAEAKGKKRNRIIYLTPRAERIINRVNTGGHIFRNSRGRPWTTTAVNCRFARLEKTLGVRFCQYMFRHAWVTRLLKRGIDSHIVARLAGHTSTRMIDTFYSHVDQDDEFMRAQAMHALNAKPAQ